VATGDEMAAVATVLFPGPFVTSQLGTADMLPANKNELQGEKNAMC
jgi:hypothetical protein